MQLTNYGYHLRGQVAGVHGAKTLVAPETDCTLILLIATGQEATQTQARNVKNEGEFFKLFGNECLLRGSKEVHEFLSPRGRSVDPLNLSLQPFSNAEEVSKHM